MSIKIKGLLLGLTLSFGLLRLVFGHSPMLQPKKIPQVKQGNEVSAKETLTGDAKRGYGLFNHSCAPCHGNDARGDEGPGLYDLAKSDARIASIIKGGIKGEMPSFAKKFSEADIQALIAYLRTLKD